MKSPEDVRILVVGDVILDEYVMGEVSRISPEAPIPILRETSRRHRLGGAANVAANVGALGATALLLGLVGADNEAQTLEAQCRNAQGVEPILLDGLPFTVCKTRFVSGQQQMLRLDREECLSMVGEDVAKRRDKEVEKAARECDAIIVSDYDKGIVDAALMATLHKTGLPVVVDPKPLNAALYQGVMLVTPNLKEAREIVGTPFALSPGEIASAVRDRLGTAVLITMGAEGMYLQSAEYDYHIEAEAQDVFDVTGAGDTVVAILTTALVAGFALDKAAMLANSAAAKTVSRHGTATLTPEEVRTIGFLGS